MPLIGTPTTPLVSMTVPVPTPVQPKRQPKPHAARIPKEEEARGPQLQPFTPPPRPQLRAVILPWTPPVQRMKRLLEKAVRLARDWGKGWWMSPKGEVHELKSDDEHDTWLSENTQFKTKNDAMDNGWLRMVSSRNNLYVEGPNPNKNQLISLKDHAIANHLNDITHFDHRKEWGKNQRTIRMKRLPKKVIKYSSFGYTHENFHDTIMENTEADTPPLVYADWLEENNMPVLAHFIREAVRKRHAPHYESTSIMKYTHKPRETDDAKELNSVFVHQGLGAYREPLRDRIGRVRRRPKPTLAVSVRSPYSEKHKGFLSFSQDLPMEEGERVIKDLLREGHPAGNEGAVRRKKFL